MQPARPLRLLLPAVLVAATLALVAAPAALAAPFHSLGGAEAIFARVEARLGAIAGSLFGGWGRHADSTSVTVKCSTSTSGGSTTSSTTTGGSTTSDDGTTSGSGGTTGTGSEDDGGDTCGTGSDIDPNGTPTG